VYAPIVFIASFGSMWNTLTMSFNLVGLVLLFQFLRFKWLDYQTMRHHTDFWTYKRHKYILTLGGLLGITSLVIQFLLPEQSPFQDQAQRLHLSRWLGGITSFGISLMWAIYLWKLDIFEPEKWHHLLLVFLFGCATTFMVFPIASYVNNTLLFQLNNELVNDFLYCFIGIGMVEEFVKLIPLLLFLRFTKVINEPYDYLLYASISALGFAFIENTLYIQKTSFYAVNGRALMSTVAHMTFSGVVGYSFMIASHRPPGRGWFYVFGGFLLASLMHGFYDFWLINPTARAFSGLSYLFLIGSIHYWFTIKNKAISASYFYDRRIRWVNDRLRYYLLSWLVVILASSSLLIGIFHGAAKAHDYFTGQIFAYGFLIYYIGLSFSRFTIAPKAAAVCQLVVEKTIPKEPGEDQKSIN
jgi:RsiW-degrading membrane proteinase PrsW (M82 family)